MHTKSIFYMYRIPFYFLFILINFSMIQAHQSKQVWIIIHGTFAQYASWHKPNNTFITTLKKHLNHNAEVHRFLWSGKNSYQARAEAGILCKDYIKNIMPPNGCLHIIGHSHGGNVAIIAAEELAKENSSIFIDSLTTLATPVCMYSYLPNMNRIKKIYNLFSYGDRIQPVMQIFKRTFPDHENIYNIQVKYNQICPSHMEMRNPFIAAYIPHMKELVLHKKNDLVIHFFDKKQPIVTLDFDRKKDLETDFNFTQHMFSYIAENRYDYKNKLASFSKLSARNWALRFGDWRNINSK